MVLFPKLVGSVEIEERRPRYWNEPRRKRLNFVKSRKPNRNTEWQVAPRSLPQAFPRNEQERWDQQQLQVQERFMHNEARRAQFRRQQEYLQWQAQMQQRGLAGQPRQQIAQHPQQGGIPIPPQHHGHQGHQAHQAHHGGQQGRAHYGDSSGSSSEDDIVAVLGSSDSDSDSDDHRGHGHHGKKKKVPKMIEMHPQKLPKLFYPKDDKKKSNKKKGSHKSRSRSRIRRYDVYDDGSSDDSFAKFGRSHSRGRRPSRLRLADDSSDSDGLVYHRVTRLSSKHRGRH